MFISFSFLFEYVGLSTEKNRNIFVNTTTATATDSDNDTSLQLKIKKKGNGKRYSTRIFVLIYRIFVKLPLTWANKTKKNNHKIKNSLYTVVYHAVEKII